MIDRVEAGVEFTRVHAQDLSLNGVVEIEGIEDEVERFTQRDLLEIADEPLIERGCRHHAELGVAHEQQQHVSNRRRH